MAEDTVTSSFVLLSSFRIKFCCWLVKNLSDLFSHKETITGFYGWLHLPTQVQLTDTSLNTHQNHNNPYDNGGHLPMTARQRPTKASNAEDSLSKLNWVQLDWSLYDDT